ncbi:MAG: Gldg family protein [Deltaproteobacteria bacterium]|nr:Gldg family protein [Deltaproteobacteria bacterium]
MGVTKRAGSYIKFFAYLVIVVLINVAGITLFVRKDMTKNKAYSISEASQAVVSTLSEPLTIKVFFTKNLPAPHNNTEQYLRDLLEEYSIYANRYFNYRFYDVSPEDAAGGHETESNREMARSYGIYPVQIQNIEADEIKFQKAYMGLVLIHGDIVERISNITSTDGLEYQLTTAIRKLNNKVSTLLGLPEKIRIKLVMSSSLRDVAPHIGIENISEIPEQLKDTVDKLNGRLYGKLEFEYVDPTEEGNLEDILKKYRILNLKWPALPDGKVKAGEGAAGLVMEYGGKVAEVQLISVFRLPVIGTRYQLVDMKNMEDIISESIESLIDINENLGYLADRGTVSLSGEQKTGAAGQPGQSELSNFQSLTSQNYTIKEITLKDGVIPEGIKCLVIAGPAESFTDYELFQIDQFLMKGNSLYLMLDALKESETSGFNRMPTYLSQKTGLEKLLEHYGIKILDSYVMDENCYRQKIPAQFGGGERPIYFAPVIQNRNINGKLDFMRNIKGMVAVKISPLKPDAERIEKNGLKAHRLFASSDRSWEMKGMISLNPAHIRPPQSADEMGSLPLSYILEGEFPSYFAGKQIPERVSGETEADREGHEESAEKGKAGDLPEIVGEGRIIQKGKPGKLFITASSEMLTDNVIDEKGRTPNAIFVLNVLDYLNNREGTAVMRSKEQTFNPLDETGQATKTFVKSFNIAGLPVIVGIFGLLVWFGRHSRKKRIQTMFKKSL